MFQDNRSLVIGLSFTCEDPDLAAKFVNTLTGAYIKARAEHRDAADRGANGAINQRIADVKAGLDKIEQQMQDLRSRGDIVALRAGSVGQQQVEELATAAAKASVDRSALEANWNRANSLARSGSSDALAGVLDSPTVSRLRDQESLASSKLAELSSKYGSGYPAVRSAAADLASVRGQLGGEVSPHHHLARGAVEGCARQGSGPAEPACGGAGGRRQGRQRSGPARPVAAGKRRPGGPCIRPCWSVSSRRWHSRSAPIHPTSAS